MPVRSALDAIGGDRAPGVIVKGVLRAIIGDADLALVLVGDEARIRLEPDLEGMNGNGAGVQIVHASQVVRMDDPPAEATKT